MATQIDLYRRIREAMSDDAEVVALCNKHILPAEERSNKSAERARYVHGAVCRLVSRGVNRFSARMVREECGGVFEDRPLSIQAVSRSLGRLLEEGLIEREESVEKGEPVMYRVS